MSLPTSNTESFDAVATAKGYRAWFDTPLGRRVWADERRALFDVLTPVRGRNVLDAGSGDGRFAIELAARGARVTAVDRSWAMLSHARAEDQTADTRVRMVRGDVTNLPFATATFDQVVCLTVLCFVSDPRAAIRELARVLKPGGQLVIGELGRWCPWNLWRWGRGRTGDPMWRNARFWTVGSLKALMRDAGLRPEGWSSAVFYTPRVHSYSWARRFERRLRGKTSLGAAFLAVASTRMG